MKKKRITAKLRGKQNDDDDVDDDDDDDDDIYIYIYIYFFFSLGSSSQFRILEEEYIIARPVNVA